MEPLGTLESRPADVPCGAPLDRQRAGPDGDARDAEGLLGRLIGDRARAGHLLKDHSLRELAAMDGPELVHGLGLEPHQAQRLAAGFELAVALRHAPPAPDEPLTCAARVHDLLAPDLAGALRETFVALLLDGKHRLRRTVCVSIGTLTTSLVHPREVFRPAIRHGAAALIVAHNHPSGDPEPSREDLEVTRRLRDVGELVGIPLLDHVVLGDGRHVSLRERLPELQGRSGRPPPERGTAIRGAR